MSHLTPALATNLLKTKKCKSFIALSLITYLQTMSPGIETSLYSQKRRGAVLEALACCYSLCQAKIKAIFLIPPKLGLRISFWHRCTESQDFWHQHLLLIYSATGSLYLLISLTYFFPPQTPIPSGNHLFVLCIYNSASILLYLFICFVF